MDLGIENKKFVVTGGAGGLGFAVVRQLLAEGAHVLIADVDYTAAKDLANKCVTRGWFAEPMELDLGALDGLKHKVQEMGDVDGLVNICGGPPPGPIQEVSVDDWQTYIDRMLLGTFEVTRRLVKLMRERKWGRIVTCTSSGVIVPIDNLGISNTLRSALLGWSKTLANEVASDGVTCNVVVPGRVATGRIASLDEKKANRLGVDVVKIREESTKSIPIGRYGDPVELGSVVAFLCSEPARYITGSIVRVDGGYVKSI